MIGAIADDFTGATDIAVAFRRAGLRVVIHFADPTDDALPEHDVAIVALKSRTIPAEDAVRQSLHAVRWLRAHGAQQIFFKYCSTFDSTAAGNIGPVTDALMDELEAKRTVFVPASPEHLRTQYMGHLYVDRLLLSDSHMRHHPLTPMTNSFIPDVLAAQTCRRVGLIDESHVHSGAESIRAELADAVDQAVPYVVVDAITDADLRQIGEAVADDPLVTGAAGIAAGLGHAVARRLGHARRPASVPARAFPAAPTAVLAGSCSARTLEQIDAARAAQHPSFRLDAIATPDADALAAQALVWFDEQPERPAPMIYSSLPPAELKRVQDALGVQRSSDILETAMGKIAEGLVDRGVRRVVVAGGETSGAVVTALGITGGQIGAEAAPGVPWIHTGGDEPLELLLKSGNFGDVNLLARAAEEAVR
ncbi:3-oxo-tetronate kinase [Microbacterium sp. 5K110]|jgi:uncharacterized protein YgbK (DUF1537 family)|uniref:3-oxo-tetronate kinase n=1 Tax=unclassified Microbacterium TaxID=2609290 RepID=UPI0010FE3AB2|nr:3-oxo-tetronate kinase [Microbacterium sp. 5K110]TLF30900.1 four-carbon acid sugar kinase family protein [Microbacterium sp. 5K110]